MQPIERYGVITLMFLIVTIIAVALWDDGDEEEPSAAQTQLAEAQRAAGRRGQAKPDAPLPERKSVAQHASSAAVQRPAPKPAVGAPQPLPSLDPQSPGIAGSIAEPAARVLARVEERRRAERGRGAREEESRPAVSARQPKDEPQPHPPQHAQRASRSTPEPEARRAKADPSRSGTYTVAAGDSLSLIAQTRLGAASRWRDIAEVNGIADPLALKAGQVLVMPGSDAAPAPRSEQPKPQAQPRAGSEYVVQKGDVLGSIAQERLGKASRWREIVALNPGLDPNRLTVGKRLVLPAGAAVPEPERSRPSDERVVTLTPASALRRGSKVR